MGGSGARPQAAPLQQTYVPPAPAPVEKKKRTRGVKQPTILTGPDAGNAPMGAAETAKSKLGA